MDKHKTDVLLLIEKQIERQVIITYRWWRDEGVLDKHIEALEESAMDRIQSQMTEGYTSGELIENIIMDEEDGDGVEYQGWWEVTTKNIE